MPGNSDFTTGTETPGKGTLKALLESLGAARPEPRPTPQIDPERARQALKALLRMILADDERGRRARAALKRMGDGAVELLRALSDE